MPIRMAHVGGQEIAMHTKIASITLPLLLAACSASTHATRPAGLGAATSSAAMEAALHRPGPLQVQTVVGADWAVTREGLINLDHPRARAAKLEDGDEPIHIYAHVLRHPTRGIFLVDSGVARGLATDPARAGIGWAVRQAMHLEKMKLRTDTASLLAELGAPLAGVFLTHLHLDHIAGLPDVPRGVPLYAGPGETRDSRFLHLFSRGSIDGLLAGHAPVSELSFAPDPSGRFEGILDVFGDESLFALWVPGHTPGSVAFVARTPDGPVLITGDACHTRWGWQEQVEPGTFSSDQPRSARNLAALEALASRHPRMSVRLGHQQLPAAIAKRAIGERAIGGRGTPHPDPLHFVERAHD
jgi:glyoxylase-like metal-dependent hydrolase (beta-lactamase superfamily II)